MQKAIILNMLTKLSVGLGIFGLAGLALYLITAIVRSVKNKSATPFFEIFPRQPWYFSFINISITTMLLVLLSQ